MPKQNNSKPVEAPVEVIADQSTAEIEGDNVVEIEDYTDVIALEEAPHLIFDENGVKVTEHPLQRNGEWIESPISKDWHFEWVANDKHPKGSRVEQKRMQHYDFVTANMEPKVKVPSVSAESVKRNSGKFVVDDLTLMRCPMKVWKMRQGYFQELNHNRMRAIKRDLEEIYPDGDFYGEVKVSRGRLV